MFFYSFMALALLLAPLFSVQAVTVKNFVSSSANSGGNVAESGQVIEGVAKTDVSVQTTIDGNIVEDIRETDEGDGSASVEVRTNVGNSAAASQVEVKIGGVTRGIKQPALVVNGTSTAAAGATTTTPFLAQKSERTNFVAIIRSIWGKIKHVFSFTWI